MAPRLQHVGVFGHRQRQARILLHQQDRQSAPVYLDHGLVHFFDDLGRQAMTGLIEQQSRGASISARPKATICCSPPDSVPASCRRRSPSLGNRA